MSEEINLLTELHLVCQKLLPFKGSTKIYDSVENANSLYTAMEKVDRYLSNYRPTTREWLDKAQIKKDIAEFVYKDAMKDITKFNLTDAIVDYICQKYGTKQEMRLDEDELFRFFKANMPLGTHESTNDYILRIIPKIVKTFSKPAVVYPEKVEEPEYDPDHESWGNAGDSYSHGYDIGYANGANDKIDLFRKMNS